MADGGHKDIADVTVGDKVVATDPVTHETNNQKVTAVIVGDGEKHLVDITIGTDADAGDDTATLTATDGHLGERHTRPLPRGAGSGLRVC
jgi:hypothetical protein